ncbi:MAG: hypothetical protein E7054_07020 [Lentisphaerae bacterium]|nr:hypothetical protein [Lentisphaerota bacterium]
MLSEIPELLYNDIGKEISNLFFAFGEQELTVFEKSSDEITADNIASVYVSATKKIRTIDFYYDGNLLQNSAPIALRSGFGTKNFPFSGKELSQTAGSFLYCLDNALQQSCPETMIRIFCRGRLKSMYGFSAILCPWPEDKDTEIILDSESTFKVVGSSKTASIYFVNANIAIEYQDSYDSSGCNIYANGCRIGTTAGNDNAITLSNWSFYDSIVDLSCSKFSLLSGLFCINSTFSLADNYSHNSGSLGYDFFKDCDFNFSISATHPDPYKTYAKINYAYKSNITAEALETSGVLWVDCQLLSRANSTGSTWYGYGACGANTAVNCTATVYTNSSCQIFCGSSTKQTYINCIANLHIVEEIKQDFSAVLFHYADVTDCSANVVIDCSIIDSEIEIQGYYLGSQNVLKNSNANCSAKIKASSTTYNKEYYSGSGINYFAAGTYSSDYSITNLTSVKFIDFSYITPGNSSNDIYGNCKFHCNYAKIAAGIGGLNPRYIETECKSYEFSNNSAKAWPTIGETCIW